MTLMLTVAPILWGYIAFLCIGTYPGQNLVTGAVRTAVILVLIAVAMDFIFFGLVRNAMQQLYHPTTFYAYGFLICLPFIVVLLFRNAIRKSKMLVTNAGFATAGISGLACFGILSLIILFEIGV